MTLGQVLVLAGCVVVAMTQVEVLYRWLDRPARHYDTKKKKGRKS